MIFGKRIVEFIKRKLYPPRCIFCRDVLADDVKLCVCKRCSENIKRIPSERCPVCGLVTPLGSNVCWSCASKKMYFNYHRSPYFYEDDVRRTILRLKFARKAQYCKTMGIIMAAYIPYDVNFDCVTWVPMTKKQVKQRGFNQSELLAREIAKVCGFVPCELLVKIKNTEKQSKTKASKRAENVKGAFSCGHDLHGKNILLIDDVFTTGATLNECSKVLKKRGADRIYCLTFASAKPKH